MTSQLLLLCTTLSKACEHRNQMQILNQFKPFLLQRGAKKKKHSWIQILPTRLMHLFTLNGKQNLSCYSLEKLWNF